MRLTKKRLAALNAALSFDDMLHERFRRLTEDFDRHQRRYMRTRQIAQVVRLEGKRRIVCAIVREVRTPNGIYVEVR